jgi:4-hydroxybenzoate polyprenyltransferase
VLGLTFKWGALVGWAAVKGTLELPALLLYAGSVLWTIGYDTIYAHQDKEDDQVLGLKSSALRLGSSTQTWLVVFYGGAVTLWAVASYLAGAHILVGAALVAVAAQLAWQIATLDIDDPGNCLQRFRSNCLVGWIYFVALVADAAISALGS